MIKLTQIAASNQVLERWKDLGRDPQPVKPKLKYATLDEIVNKWLLRATNDLYKYFTGTHVDCRQHGPADPVITEDIDCEVIHPKQLPGAL